MCKLTLVAEEGEARDRRHMLRVRVVDASGAAVGHSDMPAPRLLATLQVTLFVGSSFVPRREGRHILEVECGGAIAKLPFVVGVRSGRQQS